MFISLCMHVYVYRVFVSCFEKMEKGGIIYQDEKVLYRNAGRNAFIQPKLQVVSP